jgi:histidinol-phosphate phosphatase family protein
MVVDRLVAAPVRESTGRAMNTHVGLFDAVLFDRDGTLIEDVPYNGDPAKVRAVPGARVALDRLRGAGLRVGVVSNQSGLARGLFTGTDLARVNARVDELLGPFATWQICPHDAGAGCPCRKPAPGLIRAAARALGCAPARCAVVGDIGADMAAALAAGASAILVPNAATLDAEVKRAPAVVADLPAAVDLVLARQRLFRPSGAVAVEAPDGGRVLAVRSDSAGDVLITGPAIQAVAARAGRLVLMCGARGRAAAALLPGGHDILQWTLPWIEPRAQPIQGRDLRRLVGRLTRYAFDEAIIFTSYHQSALPLAVLLRMAGVPRISAISDDYPGSLLDLRHRVPVGIPEPERALSLAAAAGYPLPSGLTGLRVTLPPVRPEDYVVVHPGASVPQRAAEPERLAATVRALAGAGHRVLVTGGPNERGLTATVAAAGGTDLGGRTALTELGSIIAAARCVVVGNTGPAHLAAAVGTPVVSLFADTVPFGAWAPWRVPVARLDPDAAADEVLAAVSTVARGADR